jgi:hypothetical protein
MSSPPHLRVGSWPGCLPDSQVWRSLDTSRAISAPELAAPTTRTPPLAAGMDSGTGWNAAARCPDPARRRRPGSWDAGRRPTPPPPGRPPTDDPRPPPDTDPPPWTAGPPAHRRGPGVRTGPRRPPGSRPPGPWWGTTGQGQGRASPAAALTRQPHRFAGNGLRAYLARGPRRRVRPSVRRRLLERIPSPLTLSGDLGKRRSAQR